jgi:hypothetical protein
VQTLEHYLEELKMLQSSLYPTSKEGGLGDLHLAATAFQETDEIAEVCQGCLDKLLETYVEALSEHHPMFIQEWLRQQYLEFNDIRIIILRFLSDMLSHQEFEQDSLLKLNTLRPYAESA